MEKHMLRIFYSILGTVGGLITLVISFLFLKDSEILMPIEYKYLQEVVNELARSNKLGERPISFTIVSGSFTAWSAAELGLCRQDNCAHYRELNPFINYLGENSEDINEAIRQSYLFNGIEAYSWPNGTITISRSTFRSYGDNKSFLGCLIGHELTHFLNNDVFNQSLRSGQEGSDLNEEERNLLSMRISRELETKADIGGAKMLINAGFPKKTCLDELTFSHQIEGNGYETREESSHPGYNDRYSALKDFIDAYSTDENNSLDSTKGDWKFNRDDNVLIYIPGL